MNIIIIHFKKNPNHYKTSSKEVFSNIKQPCSSQNVQVAIKNPWLWPLQMELQPWHLNANDCQARFCHSNYSAKSWNEDGFIHILLDIVVFVTSTSYAKHCDCHQGRTKKLQGFSSVLPGTKQTPDGKTWVSSCFLKKTSFRNLEAVEYISETYLKKWWSVEGWGDQKQVVFQISIDLGYPGRNLDFILPGTSARVDTQVMLQLRQRVGVEVPGWMISNRLTSNYCVRMSPKIWERMVIIQK